MPKPRKHSARKSRRVAARRSLQLLAAAASMPRGMMQFESGDVVLSAAGTGEGSARPAFKMLAYTGGRMRPMYYPADVVVDISKTRIAAGKRPSFLGHDPRQIVGHCESVEIDGVRILAEGVISGAGDAADEVIESAANGFPWRSSIGMAVDELRYIDAETEVEVNGKKWKGPLFVAHGTVHEVSFVPLAGDPRATATVSAGLQLEIQAMQFDAWLKAQGFDPATLSDAQKKALRAAFDVAMAAAAGDPPAAPAAPIQAASPVVLAPVAPPAVPAPAAPIQAAAPAVDASAISNAAAAAVRAETTRIADITRICAQFGNPTMEVNGQQVPVADHAIAAGMTLEQAELHALRASRSRAPGAIIRGGDTASLQTLQAAMLLRAGLALDNPAWLSAQAIAIGVPSWIRQPINAEERQRTMNAAHQYSDMSLLDLCAAACRIEGREPPRHRSELIQAAFSTQTLVNIFTANMAAGVLATYLEGGDTTLEWTSSVDVADFKVNDRIRMVKGPALEKLPRTTEAKHATRSDVIESYRIARYAKQFVVDEQDIIDDRFNALQEMPIEMGLAAARLRPDLVYSILKANAALSDGVALFHSSHGNTDTSAGLASDKLKAGITAITVQRDNGVNLNLMPTHLIVPAALSFTADELINSSQIVIAGTAGSVTERGNLNTLASRGLSRVSDARLDNGVTDPDSGTTHSGDANDWFLAASGAHTIEVAYLRGTGRVPQIRSFVLDRGQWGIGWDVKFDIGAKALDYRGLYRGQG